MKYRIRRQSSIHPKIGLLDRSPDSDKILSDTIGLD